MAGQDQSANLGGMLTDIGKTMGSMGDAYKPVLQAATKPRGDMNDPAHLANLAQWATQHGDTAAASMYMAQAREAKSDARYQAAELKQKRTEAIDQAKVGMVNKYAKAVESGTDVQKAYDELMEFSSNASVDVQAQIGGIDQRKATQDAQQRAAERDAEEKAEKGFRTTFNAQLSGAKDPTALLAKVPDQFRETAQIMIAREVQFQEQVQERDQKQRDVSSPVSTEVVTSSIASIRDTDIQEAFNGRMEALKPEDHGWDGKRWNTPVDRHRYEQKIQSIEKEAFAAHTAELADEKSEARYAERARGEAVSAARKNKVTQSEIDAWATANGKDVGGDWSGFGVNIGRTSNNVTRAEAIAGVISERIQAIGMTSGPSVGDIVDGMRFMGGDPASPANWETATE
jgi:hypothetical protein